MIRAFRRFPNLTVGGAIVGFLAIVIGLGPFGYSVDPYNQVLVDRLVPPSQIGEAGSSYWLGTDTYGRDILARILHGGRISLTVALSAILLGAFLGVTVGTLAGFLGGYADAVFMRLTDGQQSLPAILVAIMIVTMLGASVTNLIIVLAITTWSNYARVVYGVVRSVKQREFVLASRVTGASSARIMRKHILPQVSTPILVTGAVQVGRMIQVEAALSFLGLGVPPPTPSWGAMLYEGQRVLWKAPWVAIIPGLAIGITVLGINLLGEGLRQILDPRIRTM